MSKFKQLNSNITKVMSALIENQNLCKLVTYKEVDALARPDIEDTSSLLYENLFPFPVSIDVDKDPKIFIAVALDNFSSSSNNYIVSNNKLVFNILCPNNLWRIDEGLRPFSIMEELDNIFCNNPLIGIGKMLFDSANLIYAKDYTGYRVAYKITGINY